MLTRELLMHRTRSDRIRPTFVDLKNASLRVLAKDLIGIFESSSGDSRDLLQTKLDGRLSTTRKAKVSKGLVKLLFDRTEFETPAEEITDKRFALFELAIDVFRGQASSASMDDYRAQVSKQFGRSLEAMEDGLYSDLLGRRRLESFKPITPEALLHRYNLAQVQGLLLYAQRLELSLPSPPITVLRRVLRWLRFCRLVAEVRQEKKDWKLLIDGPGSILSMQKKYGLQLAQFMSVVPILETFSLVAEIQLPRRSKAELRLSQEDGLRSHHRGGSGHIPEEISKTAAAFQNARWSLDIQPKPRHFGPTEMCVPDFCFYDAKTGTSVSVELFHRWHQGPLLRRIEALQRFPDPNFVLGLDKALASSAEMQSKIENNAQIFVFNAFPSLSKLQKVLRRFE